jgi:hypothetical protein
MPPATYLTAFMEFLDSSTATKIFFAICPLLSSGHPW